MGLCPLASICKCSAWIIRNSSNQQSSGAKIWICQHLGLLRQYCYMPHWPQLHSKQDGFHHLYLRHWLLPTGMFLLCHSSMCRCCWAISEQEERSGSRARCHFHREDFHIAIPCSVWAGLWLHCPVTFPNRGNFSFVLLSGHSDWPDTVSDLGHHNWAHSHYGATMPSWEPVWTVPFQSQPAEFEDVSLASQRHQSISNMVFEYKIMSPITHTLADIQAIGK